MTWNTNTHKSAHTSSINLLASITHQVDQHRSPSLSASITCTTLVDQHGSASQHRSPSLSLEQISINHKVYMHRSPIKFTYNTDSLSKPYTCIHVNTHASITEHALVPCHIKHRSSSIPEWKKETMLLKMKKMTMMMPMLMMQLVIRPLSALETVPLRDVTGSWMLSFEFAQDICIDRHRFHSINLDQRANDL